MKEKLKNMRINVTLSAVLSVVIGICLLVYPEQSISTIGKLVAVVIILAGISIVVSQAFEFGLNVPGICVGGVLALIGIWIFISPEAILSIIPIAIGVLLVVHGIQDLSMAIESAKAKAPRVWISFVIAALNIVLGFICIARAFGMVNLAFRIIGIMLIFDGITDFGVVHQVNKATKDVVDGKILKEEDVF